MTDDRANIRREYITRGEAADLMQLIAERAETVYNGRGRRAKEIQRAIRETAETFVDQISNPEIIEAADVEKRVYSYMRAVGDYRHMFCDEKITCAACGFSRPMLRGERILRCQNCGAYYTGTGV